MRRLSQNHLRAQPLTPADASPDEPRQVARLLQGPLRRCERLHLRLRGELRSRNPEAARGALPGEPSGAPPERAPKDVGMRPPAGVVQKQVKSGIAAGARSASCSAGRSRTMKCIGWSPTTMGDTLPETCTEHCGRTWAAPTASASSRFTKRPTAEYRLTINFACDPGSHREPRQDRLRSHRSVQEEGPE